MEEWEVIDDSIGNSISYLDGIESDFIRTDHFSLDRDSPDTDYVVEDQVSVESDNPSWIDPVSETRTKPITEVWTTDSDDVSELGGNKSSVVEIEEEERKVTEVLDERNGRVAAWCKLPLDLLRYCLFKASPVWSLSIAAAMMGVVILGRRLYKMKQNARTLQLTMDDKKVSQVMTRAARLNEAFTVVKRAPIIRPSLPVAGGIAPWPMMALR